MHDEIGEVKVGDICIFESRLTGAGEMLKHELPLVSIDHKEGYPLYNFETLGGKMLSVRREEITSFYHAPTRKADLQVKNADSFTEFLFDKVVKFKDGGAIPEEDPVYRFSRRFFQDLGWPVDAQHKSDFQAYLFKKIHNEFFEFRLEDILPFIEHKAPAGLQEFINKNTHDYAARIFEVNYVLELAWADFEKHSKTN